MEAADATVNALKARLIQSGEWNDLIRDLRAELQETGWEDRLKDTAKEEARNSQNLEFATLLDSVSSNARTSIPGDIRAAYEARIRAMLEAKISL